jgi:hypothetical protein
VVYSFLHTTKDLGDPGSSRGTLERVRVDLTVYIIRSRLTMNCVASGEGSTTFSLRDGTTALPHHTSIWNIIPLLGRELGFQDTSVQASGFLPAGRGRGGGRGGMAGSYKDWRGKGGGGGLELLMNEGIEMLQEQYIIPCFVKRNRCRVTKLGMEVIISRFSRAVFYTCSNTVHCISNPHI